MRSQLWNLLVKTIPTEKIPGIGVIREMNSVLRSTDSDEIHMTTVRDILILIFEFLISGFSNSWEILGSWNWNSWHSCYVRIIRNLRVVGMRDTYFGFNIRIFDFSAFQILGKFFEFDDIFVMWMTRNLTVVGVREKIF